MVESELSVRRDRRTALQLGARGRLGFNFCELSPAPHPPSSPAVYFRRSFRGRDLPRKTSSRWARQPAPAATGRMLAAFPAGEARIAPGGIGTSTDPPWNPTIAKIIPPHLRSGGLAVYFAGQTGNFFKWMGLVHPAGDIAVLPVRGCLRKRAGSRDANGKCPLPAKNSSEIATDEASARSTPPPEHPWLQHRPAASAAPRQRKTAAGAKEDRRPAEHPAAMAGETICVHPENLLVEHEHFAVYQACEADPSRDARRLGRLREITFLPLVKAPDAAAISITSIIITSTCSSAIAMCDEIVWRIPARRDGRLL